MKKFLFATTISILALSSCVKYTDNTQPSNPEESTEIVDGVLIPTAKVNFDIKTKENLSNTKVSAIQQAGEFSRSTAPVYVSGVHITSTCLETYSKVVNGDFDFVDINQNGLPITMMIPLGSNRFDAISKAKFLPLNSVYKNSIDLVASTVPERNKAYSDALITKQGIYAIYNGTVTKTITTSDYAVQIPMTTQNARYSVVLETSSNYDLDMDVVCNGKTSTILKANSTKASAVVLNEADLVGTKDVVITIKVYAKGKTEVSKTIYVKNNSADYKTTAGVNNTLLLSYNASGQLITQETGITFTWVNMKDEGSVVNID